MLECHANAWFIRPGKCLGRKLKHFTPARLFLLEAINSPLVFGGVWGLDQLLQAVLVCSVPPCLARWLLTHQWAFSFFCFWWGVSVRLNSLNVLQEGLNFQEYIRVYMDHPAAMRGENEKERYSAFPHSVTIVWTLMERMSERKAWRCPMPLALAFTGRQAEYNGTEFRSEAFIARPYVCVIHNDEKKEG